MVKVAAALVSALLLLTLAQFVHRNGQGGPVWNGGDLLVADCVAWQERLQPVEPRTHREHKRFDDAGVELTVYNRHDVGGRSLVLMIRQTSGTENAPGRCHIVTVSEAQGFARLSVEKTELTRWMNGDMVFEADTGIVEGYYYGEAQTMGYPLFIRISAETGNLTATLK